MCYLKMNAVMADPEYIQLVTPHRSQADQLFDGLGEAVTAPVNVETKRQRVM